MATLLTISEVISRLEALKAENGDINVVVQYRDGGGVCDGVDTEMYFLKEEISIECANEKGCCYFESVDAIIL